MERRIGDRIIRLTTADITNIEVEAFVFDIDEDCKLGSGYGGAITARGGKAVQDELDAIGSCAKADAIVTGGGRLPVKHIIHTNGPKFHEPDTEGILRRCTLACLARAEEKGIAQVAFPPIGTGLYQVPIDLCARVMVRTVSEFLGGDTPVREVLFVALNTREQEPFAAALQGGS